MRILGIDLGTNSLGIAVRDTEKEGNQIENYNVVIFDKGVATEEGKEFPKVQKRTESRGKRRNYQAEKYRKYELLKFLIEKKMCPLTNEELSKWRDYRKGEKRIYPQSERFVNWLRFDFNGDGKPDFHLLGKDKQESHYAFRAFAVDENYKFVFDANPEILGRVFYQLVQRRGFRGRDEEEAKTILKGSEKTGTKGRDEISDYIENHPTLGAALYHFQKEKGGRIRQRYNLRKDFENELKEICRVHNISQEDYSKLWKSLIWQRPLRTQKGLIGKCIYERNKKRAPISHPLYEEYRTWVFINNLNITPPFQEELMPYLKKNIYPLFFKTATEFELSVIDKQLKKDGAKRNSKHHTKTKVVSAKILNLFKTIYGDQWRAILEFDDISNRDKNTPKRTDRKYTSEDLWHILHTFDGRENLKDFALNNLHLNEEHSERFSKFKTLQGYATLSLSAIKKILPFLKKGYLYSHAVYLANIPKVIGSPSLSHQQTDDLSQEIEKILAEDKENILKIKVVNDLLSIQINDEEQRYQLDDNQELSDVEIKDIRSKIVETYGEETFTNFSQEKQQEIEQFVTTHYAEFLRKPFPARRNCYLKREPIHESIFEFLKKNHQLSEDMKKHLWHPSEHEQYEQAKDYYEYYYQNKNYYVLPENQSHFEKVNQDAEFDGRIVKLLGSPEPLGKGLKNPMALRSLHKLKNVINYYIKTNKIDEDTRVVVEIARELNDANKRKAIETWQKNREKENEGFKKIVDEINKECGTSFNSEDRKILNKIRLWEEQGRKCIYTGKSIGLCDLLDGNKYDFEHTIPASISFDNELKNLTIADATYNRKYKGKRFPTQLQNYDNEFAFEGVIMQPIIKNIEQIFGKRKVEIIEVKGKKKEIVTWSKIEALEKQYDDYKKKASYATTKAIKDNCIVQYHILKMDLDYLRAKLKSFTITEYKSGWKNSQLRDTQIITKYALPYLKSYFKRVSVEKAEVVNNFKEIYNVKVTADKKNRSNHAHHAMDAAILTLIPDTFHRERILKKFNEQKDLNFNFTYHEQPQDWRDFLPKYVLDIGDNIFINNLTDDRRTTQTSKTVRKRGKIVYDINENGHKIKRVSKGDTIRGELHDETFYGAIKQPIRDDEGKILFDENGKMLLQDKIHIVVRKPLLYKKDAKSPGFKSLEEIEKVIVDKALFGMIKAQVEKSDFKTALEKGVYLIDKKGQKVGEKIRKIRCFSSRNKYENILKVHTHNFTSDKDYKKMTLVTNAENAYLSCFTTLFNATERMTRQK